MLPILLFTLLLSVWVLNLLGYMPPPQPVFELFMEEKRSKVLFFLAIFVSVFGPVAEELFFRGFMYNAIKKHIGVFGAAFLSASIFSMLHTNIVGFLSIMTLGMLLVYLYEATGSLIASMAVHILHNSIIMGFVFFVKELMG
jgi:membrane protease YdiL (CAAX protease family)